MRNLITCSLASLCTLVFEIARFRNKPPEIKYTRAANEEVSPAHWSRASVSEPLFLQPFDAGSRSRLVPEAYDGTYGNRDKFDKWQSSRVERVVGRPRARSYSPHVMPRSESPLLGYDRITGEER
jgi:hypothetical protein